MCQPKPPATDTAAHRSSPAPGALRRFLGERRAAAAIEFAILAIPFFALLFAILETSLIFIAELTLDRGVEKVARLVRTGQVQKANFTQADFEKQICKEVNFILDCAKLKIDLKTYDAFADIPRAPPIKNGAVDTTGFGYSPGGAQAVQALRVFYNWPVATDIMRASLSQFPDGSHLLFAMSTFKTEPF